MAEASPANFVFWILGKRCGVIMATAGKGGCEWAGHWGHTNNRSILVPFVIENTVG